MSTRKLVTVLTTLPDEGAAQALARVLVSERLAACVQRTAIASTYRWKGRIEDAAEVLLLIKSTDDLVDSLRARLIALHPYEVAEFVVLTSDVASQAYVDWVRSACIGSD